MVSSTYFDLREIRQQLALFVEQQLGYRSLISEASDFPVDPSADAIENCQRRVEANADVLVLVIGGRYGSTDQASGHSITNLEYLAARAKGIPIYAFIEQRSLALYEAWSAARPENKAGFADSVDSIKLFAFVERVRSTDRVWMFGFSAASDIIEALRAQLAYQMHAGLEWQRRVIRSAERELLGQLRGKPLQILLEKPTGWEYRLFAHLLVQELEALASMRREYDLGIAMGRWESVALSNFADWAQTRMAEIIHLSETANHLVNVSLQEAVGAPGEAGSPQSILFVARALGTVYREAMEWTRRVRQARASSEGFDDVISALATYSSSIVQPLGEWGLSLATNVDEGIRAALAAPEGSPERTIKLTLIFPDTGSERMVAAMHEAYARHGIFPD